MDKRHVRRIEMIQKLFPLGFDGITFENVDRTDSTVQSVISNLKKIDSTIETYASRYPIKKIAKIDLSILRLSIYELLIEKKQPPKVIIDEAVTLAKEFGNEKSYSFVNGVLGSVLKHFKDDEAA